jgi:hypothetical protein
LLDVVEFLGRSHFGMFSGGGQARRGADSAHAGSGGFGVSQDC